MKDNTMFIENFGYKMILKRWLTMVNLIRTTTKDSKFYLVKVDKGNLWATDGRQLLKIDTSSQEIDNGLFVLSKEGFLFPALEFEGEYPDLKNTAEKKDRDKSALIEGFGDNPLVASAYIIKEFGFVMNLDGHRKTLEAVAKFDPEYVRVWGYKDSAKNKDAPVMIECILECGQSFDLVLMGLAKDDYVKVEKTLFDNQK